MGVQLSSNSKVTVVVRTLNEVEHLEKLALGLEVQTRKVDELVLVDSGSTDGTVELAEKLGFQINFISQDEFSFGRSLNLGYENSAGDIVVNLSAHVYPLHQDFIEQLVSPFSNPMVGLTYGRQVGDETSAFSETMIMRDWYPEHPTDNHKELPFANNANSAVRRSVWEKYKFDENLPGLEDIEFCHRFYREGIISEYVPEAVVVHIHNESWKKIHNRYRREAIALVSFEPQAKIKATRAIFLFLRHCVRDLTEALKQGKFHKVALEIISFRSAQFYGAWKGGKVSKPNRALLQALYYPNKEVSKSKNSNQKRQQIEYKQ